MQSNCFMNNLIYLFTFFNPNQQEVLSRLQIFHYDKEKLNDMCLFYQYNETNPDKNYEIFHKNQLTVVLKSLWVYFFVFTIPFNLISILLIELGLKFVTKLHHTAVNEHVSS